MTPRLAGARSGQMRAVLWDLDGTLVDSGDYHWRAWRETMDAEGRPIAYEEFLESFGQRNDSILRRWMGERIRPENIARIGDAKEALYRELARTEGLAPLPGAAEWVARLHESGWRQAIASSAPAENVRVMLDVLDLTQFFDAIASAEDVTAGKPDPEVFLAAARKLGVEPARCVVVEDAAAGIEAAKRGGMMCIGVRPEGTLEADVFVRSLADLPPDAFDRLLAPRSG
jgi:beta-phosphoglucomutase family hydrolase